MAEHTIEIKKYKGNTDPKSYRLYDPHMPPIDRDGEGDVAKVQNGKWTVAKVPGTEGIKTFVVLMHYDQGSGTTVSNYTAKEIYDRVNDGEICVASVTVDGVYYQGLNLMEINHTGNQYTVVFYSIGYHPKVDTVPGYFTYYKYVMSIDSSLSEPVNYISTETVRMSAEHLKFDPSDTTMVATDVQAAIKELNTKVEGIISGQSE